ncbi:MAG: hypothetical protein U1F29_03220 [Planctomycetota bacterium]
METSSRRDVLLPALCVLASGLLALALRPGIPLDETRYLQVAREMTWNGPWLLTLNGEPYGHKPPLLFWLGHLLGALGPGLELGLRAIPALASALTVAVTARLGRAHGAPLAGWVQAAFLAPLLYAHALYFDSLLACTVVLAVAAWSARRPALAGVAASAALLTKGPAAFLSLVPLLVAADPVAGRALPGRIGRAAVCVLLACLPLAAWALTAGLLGGPEFQRELWWSQTAERVAGPSSHDEPPWFFVVVLLVGTLPATLAFLGRRERAEPGTLRARLPWAIALPVLVFSFFPGKQPHYVLPLFPMLALLAAARLERTSGTRVRVATAALGLVFAGALTLAWTQRAERLERYGHHADALLATRTFPALVLVGVLCGIAAVGLALAPRSGPRAWLGAGMLATLGLVLPVEFAFGRLLLPTRIGAALTEEPEARIATLRAQQAGLYLWMSGRRHIDDLREVDELALWALRHPGGLVVFEDKLWRDEPTARALAALDLVAVEHDLVRGTPSTLWRVHRHEP